MSTEPAQRRVVIKVSGESLQGQRDSGIDSTALNDIAQQIVTCRDRGVEIGVVVGGGNLFRGRIAAQLGMAEATAHYAGMLATIINGLALQDAIEAAGGEVRTMSALHVRQVSEIFIRRRAIRHLEKGRIVLCVGGTGNPYVTTDTAAALRGIELDAQELLMGKHGTDGVYTADPATHPDAQRYARLNYREALRQNLGVLMDASALALCEEHSLPIVVFNIQAPNAIVKTVIDGPVLEEAGTRVDHGETILAG